VLGRADEVGMVVDQSGDDRARLEVDDPGSRPLVLQHVGVLADGEDALAADRDALGEAEALVDGDDLAVEKDGVGALGGNEVEKNVKKKSYYVITVRLDKGNKQSVSQTAKPALKQGDRVKIVDGNRVALLAN